MTDPRGFLSRWARRKTEQRKEEERRTSPAPVPVTAPADGSPAGDASGDPAANSPPVPPVPPVSAPVARVRQDSGERSEPAGVESASSDEATAGPQAPVELQAVETLTPESDFKPFMRSEVEPQTRNAALKRLFADPHFDRIDEMDIYIEDYGKPDPIPPAMLRMLEQSRSLRLFSDESEPATGDESDGTGVPSSAPQVPRDPEAVVEPAPAAGDASNDGAVGVTDDAAHAARVQEEASTGAQGNAPGVDDGLDAESGPHRREGDSQANDKAQRRSGGASD